MTKLKQYPDPDMQACGCKVSWYGYLKESDAQKASKVAKHNASILEAQGYDFGYQSPGQIVPAETKGPSHFPGHFVVTIP